MKDLEKAMLEEQAYIKDKFNHIDTNLLERLSAYGYSTLQEYFDEKQDYEFSQIKFNFVEEPMPNGVAEIFKMINTNEPGVLFVDWEDTYVVCGNTGIEEFNKQYCDEHNITFFPLHTNGGTIVGSVGDFSFGVCCPKNMSYDSRYVLNNVASILQRHSDAIISVEGNDITKDGKKICGSATYEGKDVFMVIMHFSFADWSELIADICTKSKAGKKVAFVDFVSREQFKDEVRIWLLKS